jgi:flavin reductase (DIM6/NTAB) family NADH-FMN oxidoreductase RutF
MTTSTQSETLGPALGKITSGVYVLTTLAGGQKHGLLASWVMQAGFKPPAVTVAVEHDRDVLKVLTPGTKFVLNVVNEGNNDVMKRFSHYQPDQFEGLTLEETEYGIVINDTVAYLACEIKEIWRGPGDHSIVYAEIQDGKLLLNGEQKPFVHLRKNGFSY